VFRVFLIRNIAIIAEEEGTVLGIVDGRLAPLKDLHVANDREQREINGNQQEDIETYDRDRKAGVVGLCERKR
jgi:hypothetical protein